MSACCRMLCTADCVKHHHFLISAKHVVIVQLLSRAQLFATPWSIAHQAPLSMGFPGQEYWSGLPFPSPGDLPDPGIKPMSSALAGGFFTVEPSTHTQSSMGTPQSKIFLAGPVIVLLRTGESGGEK